jgi:(4-(4-[2-(gamma-L-glutamylamino)ethyl]phenoxymethyl)furan-2-yl)methanamine synthase
VKGRILGWDVGGANVKVARVDAGVDTEDPGELALIERPFPLWREPARLPEILAQLAAEIGGATTMAVTMTAELADCFPTKREGVAAVLDAFVAAFPVATLHVYGVDGRFHSELEARERPLRVAAANWMASAVLLAESYRDALLVDVGSTTTDIIPIVGGRVVAKGRTDTARLRSGELVYTGALRTPICAIVRSVPVGGRRCRVAAEHFAIAADAHLWLRRIDADGYACETPDGRGRLRDEAGARLARVVCADLETLGSDDITAIAEHVWRAQVRQIAAGVRQVLRRLGGSAPGIALLAGSGTFLARAAAAAADLTPRPLEPRLGPRGSRALPAVAVARLLARQAAV